MTLPDNDDDTEIHFANRNIAPTLWSYEPTIQESYFARAEDALLAANCAEVLGFDWQIDAYHAPINDTTSQAEYRLIVWKYLNADAKMFPTEPTESEPSDQ